LQPLGHRAFCHLKGLPSCLRLTTFYRWRELSQMLLAMLSRRSSLQSCRTSLVLNQLRRLFPVDHTKNKKITPGRGLTRRDLLQRAAWIIPTLALGAKWAYAADLSPVMAKLSTYMADARNTELPEKVVQDAKHHILDTTAAMVSGSELPP